MTASVVALVDDPAVAAALTAGFEEEGVPLVVERAAGEPLELARAASRRSPFGLGLGGAGGRIAVVLAAAPGRPYLEGSAGDARRLGHDAARLVARRSLAAAGEWGGVGASPTPPRADGES